MLDDEGYLGPDELIDHYDKNCPYCSGYHSVVPHGEGFVCAECFEYSNVVEICEWCGEGQLGGLPEESFLVGCEFCDGRAGWDKD